MNNVLAIAIISVLIGCSENTELTENKIVQETEIDTTNSVSEKEEYQSHVAKIERDTLELEDFIDSTKFITDEFKIAYPDTTNIYKISSLLWDERIGYVYLRMNYNVVSEKDSIQQYEWEPFDICSFHQKFEFGISYKTWSCKEAGGSLNTMTFPKMSLVETKELINTLFNDTWGDGNHWISETKYEPKDGGVGCYYEIKQTENQTIIEYHCGC